MVLLLLMPSPPRLCTETLLTLPDSFPSSVAFDAISSSLQSDAGERKDAIKKGNAVFAFTLKNKEGGTESWYIDLKQTGEVGSGEAPSGGKADGEWTLREHNVHDGILALDVRNIWTT